jgi:hypothetical protein
MRRLAAIDPGTSKGCALAVFLDRVLCRVDMVQLAYTGWAKYHDVVVEIPQGDGRSVPTDDLIRVAVAGARLAERLALGDVRELRPREWKGSVPKPVHHMWMWAELSTQERALLGGSKMHHAILSACERGGAERWRKPGDRYYRARELPTVDRRRITHDLLDAVALGLYHLGRLK